MTQKQRLFFLAVVALCHRESGAFCHQVTPTTRPKTTALPVAKFPSIADELENMQRRINQRLEQALDRGAAGISGVDSLLQDLTTEQNRLPFRAVAVMLVGRALKKTEDRRSQTQHRLLAEIVEMMHTAQNIHETVLDAGAATGGNVFHRSYGPEVGNKVSVLAGDYLLAQCSVGLGQFGRIEVVERMGEALQTMVHGSLLKSEALSSSSSGTGGASSSSRVPSSAAYEEQISLRTCSLLSDACTCAALLAGHDDGPLPDAAGRFGYELAAAYQGLRDLALYERSTAGSGTVDDSSAAWANTLPVILAAEASPDTRVALERALLHGGESLRRADLRDLVDAQDGRDRAVTFANNCALQAANCIHAFPSADDHAALDLLVRSVLDRSI